MSTIADPHAEKVRELAARYAEQGFDVVVDPRDDDLPFDLEGYRPDLLARRGGDGDLVEVKLSGTRLSVDRFREIAEEVRRHPGWRFILVTADDVARDEVPAAGGGLPSWGRIRERAAAAVDLAERGESAEAALLALWAALEGILRRLARRTSLPVDRLPTSTLLRHLHSHGELSMEQYDLAMRALEIRSAVAHGYDAPETVEAARGLALLVRELLTESVGRAA